ncbi:MAG TPA: DUF6428 family protein [Opitutaceae bacterium]|nr:DUF6428 family protein [Opitutaceae bacterium]
MNTSEFLDALRARPELPLAFSTSAGTVPAGYHLTEVKRVSYETMDCGAVSHRWAETQFEIWAPPVVGALPGREPMSAGKFLKIVDRVERELPLDGDSQARILAEIGGKPAVLSAIESVTVSKGRLEVALTADRTRCKAAERRVGELTGGCCGTGEEEKEPAATATLKSSESRGQCCTMAADSKLGALCGCAARTENQVADTDAPGTSRLQSAWFTPFESQSFRFMF